MTVLDDWAALRGRVAVVTGGAGGLGLPITRDLARAGVELAVCDRDPAYLASAGEQMNEVGAEVIFDCFDVRDSDSLNAFFERVDERFGRLDILVNVVGGGYRQPAIDLTPNGVMAVIRQNFVHVLEASQLAARRMRLNSSGGSIITVSSIEAHRAMPDMAVYGAMKAAVEHLTRTLAVEWGPMGIRVNTVAPDHCFPTENAVRTGWVQTTTTSNLNNQMVIPLGRKGTGADLSGCVLFLASDLSTYVTGTTLHVDGGTFAASGWVRWPDGYDNMVPPSLLNSIEP